MDRSELRALGARLLAEARAVRAGLAGTGGVQDLGASDIPAGPAGEDRLSAGFRAALRYLRDEMVLVRDRKTDTLGVLDDEMANVESLLRGL